MNAYLTFKCRFAMSSAEFTPDLELHRFPNVQLNISTRNQTGSRTNKPFSNIWSKRTMIENRTYAYTSLADPGGWGRIFFLMPKTLIFLIFLFAQAINFKHNFIEIWSNTLNNYFYFNLKHFQWFSTPPPSRWQSPRPPPKVKSWIRHCTLYFVKIKQCHTLSIRLTDFVFIIISSPGRWCGKNLHDEVHVLL